MVRGARLLGPMLVLMVSTAACGGLGDPGSPQAESSTVSPSASDPDIPGPSATEEPLGVIEDTRVVFYRTELSVINDSGVLLNLVARDGGVGIRFYKDFGFGDEQHTNPWHMGWIEGTPGYQGLAILRDWLFTAALWDEDGRLLVGRLDPHPPANAPAEARLHVRGTVDEPLVLIEGLEGQTSPILQIVTGGPGPDAEASAISRLTVDPSGTIVIGSPGEPGGLLLYDTVTGIPYLLTVSHGQLTISPTGGD
jgi:hypothetical protein